LGCHRRWIAVQPLNLAARIEGSMVFGLGHVLREKVTIKEGRVQESSVNDYLVPRMSDMPNIAVRAISTDNPPTGAGEDGLPLVGGVIGNAVEALTGVRLRELPFAPHRVRGTSGRERVFGPSAPSEPVLQRLRTKHHA
jgi:isoquinoline 1-oxidoreductase beta subunit